jgi:hypothetical protein
MFNTTVANSKKTRIHLKGWLSFIALMVTCIMNLLPSRPTKEYIFVTDKVNIFLSFVCVTDYVNLFHPLMTENNNNCLLCVYPMISSLGLYAIILSYLIPYAMKHCGEMQFSVPCHFHLFFSSHSAISVVSSNHHTLGFLLPANRSLTVQ